MLKSAFLFFLSLFFFAPWPAFPQETIELFCDWLWDAKGDSLFASNEEIPLKDLSLHSYLQRKLRDRGLKIQSWEIDAYRPFLLKWEGIGNQKDFTHWLGLDLPRKEAILPTTRCWVFWNLGPKLKGLDFSKIPKEKLILFLWEPPTVQPELYNRAVQKSFGKIFTWDDDLVDDVRFFKFSYPVLTPKLEKIPSFKEKKFSVMIARRLKSDHPKELYSKRKKTIEFFETKEPGEFDLYGFYWEKEKYKNWKGALHTNKLEKLKEYRYAICYENMGEVKGYITEKIFDCFAAGAVPVYWGASNISEAIPPDCFIDRRQFKDDEEMYRFLKKITEEEYEEYLKNASLFLLSEQAKPFTVEFFVENFLSRL